jgi:EAL and modified HD-GYP domain-containing signal transduction protein
MNNNRCDLTERHIFVAKQPVFDKTKNVFAYKLLFRSGFDNYFSGSTDKDIATSNVLSNTMHLLGIDKLSGGKPVIINLTEKLLKNKVFTIFPKEYLIVDIPSDLLLSDDIYNSCLELKKNKYLFCAANEVLNEKYERFLKLTDIVKVDFSNADLTSIQKITNSFPDVRFMAEKVETEEDFKNAYANGFTFFQGYFFATPQIVSATKIPSFKLNQIRILKEVYKKDVDLKTIEAIIKQDISLSYKLLRFLNSSAFGLKSEIRSIMHALTLLGVNEVKKWIALIAMAELGNDKPNELVVASLTRGFFMREFAKLVNREENLEDFFLFGVFSLIDALLDKKMEEVVVDLPLSKEVKGALTGQSNIYFKALNIFKKYEQGCWGDLIGLCKVISVKEEEVAIAYSNSVEQAYNLFNVCR